MRHYVSIAGVDDEFLSFLGYVVVFEDEHTKIYLHHGDETVVDKDDPFLLLDDVNDASIIRERRRSGVEVISIPGD